MRPSESLACVVTYLHHEWCAPAYHVYYGLLFGLPNAVTASNRWSLLAEALVRRLLGCLFSMYFDDSTIQDWDVCCPATGESVSGLMDILGSRKAPAVCFFW